MLRKAILISASLVAMVAAAHAARWGVNVAVAPNKIVGVVPAVTFDQQALTGSRPITADSGGRGFYLFSTPTVAMTVAPATGYKLNTVKVGAQKLYAIPLGTAPTNPTYNNNSSQTVTVTRPPVLAGRIQSTRVVSATASAIPLRYNIVTHYPGLPEDEGLKVNGALPFKMSAGYKNVAYGTTGKKIRITPGRGFKITSITVAGTSYTAVTKSGNPVTGGTGGSGEVPVAAPKNEYIELTLGTVTGHIDIYATAQFQYWVTPVISCTTSAADLSYFADPAKAVILSAVKSASSTRNAIYTWSVDNGATVVSRSYTDSHGVVTTNPKTAYFRPASGTVGTYTVTLTIVDGPASGSVSFPITVSRAATAAKCISCHTSRQDDFGVFVNNAVKASTHYVAMSSAAVPKANVCSSCHGNHDSSFDTLVVEPTGVCVTCHAAGAVGAPQVHTSAHATCNDCHNPHSLQSVLTGTHSGGTTLVKAQYVAQNVVCADCHAGSNTAILAQWADSGHGDVAGEAWFHYDWAFPGPPAYQSRVPCQPCHTTTGYINGVSGSATALAESKPGQVLTCAACHSDVATGALRTAGAYTLTTATNAQTLAFPDAGASNLCIRCHAGRESGGSINASTSDGSNISFINSHYFAAADTVFSRGGYEYAGQSYTLGYHKNAGIANVFGTGTDGPCVACHMGLGTATHTWEVVTKDEAGIITAINSNSCANCHGTLTAATLEAAKEEFHVALNALKTSLESKGMYFQARYPYYFVGSGSTAAAFTNWAAVYGADKWKGVMGAAFNYNLLEHDPGAFAHNRQYSLKLIADSCDFLADGAVDGAGVPAAVTAAVENKDFAQATAHLPAIVAAPSSAACSVCHSGGSHYGGTAFLAGQYVSETSRPVTCASCHGDPVSSTANGTILTQFASSAHGNTLSEAWRHYDWRSSSRSACQRCHAGTAFVAKLGSENDTSNAYQPTDILKPAEVLSCSVCHSDAASGAIRTAAQQFTINLSNGATVVYDVAGASTLCARCHGGRETGDSIKADTDTDGVRGFIAPHYLAAAATLYNKGGYEYAGQSYDGLGYHKNVGTGVSGTGTQGPCVACHMGIGASNHTWAAASSNGCTGCHGTLTAEMLAATKATYDAALNSLKAALEAKGIYCDANHPYFLTAPYDPAGNNTAFTNWAAPYGLSSWKDVMGAAFNYNLLVNEPGAYAHNKEYALKLIADSCDFLADGTVDGQGIPAAVITAASARLTSHQSDQYPGASTAACGTCHSSKPHFGGTAFLEGQYVSNATLTVSCASCHGDAVNATANTTIASQYAGSAHGDPIAEAWRHYDWRSSSRSACQRCHAGTAFVARLGDENNISNAYQPEDILKPAEVLSCSACHSDAATGAIRSAAAQFTINVANGATVTYDVAGASTLCARCHGGRETGESIKADTDGDGIRGYISPHYLASAGTVYNLSGYEYSGQTYDSLGSHKSIAADGNGSCVACHMGVGTANHSWNAVTKDTNGTITAVSSNACTTCHSSPTATALSQVKAQYDAALDSLRTALEANGIYYDMNHPYFLTAVYDPAGNNTAFTNWAGPYGVSSWKDVMGAAFNYDLLRNDPGAFTHNKQYALKLIADSCDFLADGAVDGQGIPAAVTTAAGTMGFALR